MAKTPLLGWLTTLTSRADSWFLETPDGLRRLVLALYGMVLPPFLAVLALIASPDARLAACGSVAILCGLAVVGVWRGRGAEGVAWIFGITVAPTLSCGIAFHASGGAVPGFLAVVGAPVAWSAALSGFPTVLTAWFTTVATTFVAVGLVGPVGNAAGSAVLAAVIHGLVGWVVYGKSWRHREARLRSLERQVNDIELVVRSDDGRIVEANDRAVDAYGYARDVLLAMNIRDLRRGDAGQVGEQMAQVPDHDALHFRTFHYRADGGAFPVEVSSRRYSAGGKAYLHSLIRDVSSQVASDEKLSAALERLSFVLDAAKDGLWDWDVRSGGEHFNEQWARMLGYEPSDLSAHISTWEGLVHPDDRPGVRAALRAHLDGEAPIYECEHRLRHKDGHWMWILTRGKVVERDADGRAVRMSGLHRDITDQKVAEALLQVRDAELRRAQNEIAELGRRLRAIEPSRR